MSEKTRDEIAFSVFLLHALADALHCLGKEYLVDDITTFAREKGYAV